MANGTAARELTPTMATRDAANDSSVSLAKMTSPRRYLFLSLFNSFKVLNVIGRFMA